MEDLGDATGVIFTAKAWSFWATILVLTVIGQFTSTKLFTRVRAYTKGRWQGLWWWGRETLMLHPLAAGAVIGLSWQDPQGLGWPLMGSLLYFGTAGVLSLGAWAFLKGKLKDRGIDVRLPGESTRPER
jgi:hypothetical protein